MLELLVEELPEGVVTFGMACRRVTQGDTHATVELEDGRALEADLVVGADGYRSVVRTALCDLSPIRRLGTTAWQNLGSGPTPFADGHRSVYFVEGRLRAGFMPAGDGLLQSWFDVPDTAGVDQDNVGEELRRLFRGWPSPAPEVLESAGSSAFEPWEYLHRSVPKALGARRLVLIGDAAHPMPPYLAQGANQALEDAWVLTREVVRGRSPAEAIKAYCRLRRRRVAFVSRFAVSPLAAGSLSWLGHIGPRSGPPTALTTAIYGGFFRASRNVLSASG